MKGKAYVVIRRSNGRDYFDLSSLSCLRKNAMNYAHDTDAQIPQWASQNPVIGTVQVEINTIDNTYIEVEEQEDRK